MIQTHSCRKVVVIGNHVPRQCGLAHFTADLAQALIAAGVETHVAAMNDRPERYDYPEIVRFEIEQNELSSYKVAAQLLNLNGYELVCLQHEFGIFGGLAGNYILTLLRDLKMPLVTTLHTVLQDPSPEQRETLEEIIQLSERVVVMGQKGKSILQEAYGVDENKIEVIPHGIPVPIDETPGFAKHSLGLESRDVLLTFGLISESKGLEMMIDAMECVAKSHPDALYLIAGKTHPNIRLAHGEQYRERLQNKVNELGLTRSVWFLDRHMAMDELGRYLTAADIYVTPYRNREQVTSGTLAYAFGWGNAVVSTPYWHAEELLADGRGVLVPFDDASAMADAVNELLDNRERLQSMQSNARQEGEKLVWPSIGQIYCELFENVRTESVSVLKLVKKSDDIARSDSAALPPINFRHIRRLTDDTGIYQHAIHDVPLRAEGYCTDDNARALLLAVRYLATRHKGALDDLGHRYLAFLYDAFNEEEGRFRNFMAFDRGWLENVGSEDSHGRAIWALGVASSQSQTPGERAVATQLFLDSLPVVEEFTSPRAWAFTLLGLHEYLNLYTGDCLARRLQVSLSGKLMGLYRHCSRPSWHWFEDVLAYDNPRLAEALLLSSKELRDGEMREVALESMEWLAEHQSGADGIFLPIGSNGHFRRGGERAIFDQQPVEAWAMVDACHRALEATGSSKWRDRAKKAFAWFLGSNSIGQPLYLPESGACCDGLHPNRVNQNQGAESTLSYQLARLRMDELLKMGEPAKVTAFTNGHLI